MVTMASAALAWQDCMLMSISLVLAHRLFLLHMDRGAPWRALAAAINVFSAGVLEVGMGLVLIAGIAAAWLSWWTPTSAHPAALLLQLATGAAGCCWARNGRAQALQELRLWLWLFAGVALAMEANDRGLTLAPCLLVSAVGVCMLWSGWKLATESASSLLHADSGSR